MSTSEAIPMPDDPGDSGHDAAWLAFRYVQGEMSAGEEQRFEERLAGDETLCDHVAEAVMLAAAVREVETPIVPSVPASSVTSSTSRPVRVASAFALLSASVVMVIVVIGAWFRPVADEAIAERRDASEPLVVAADAFVGPTWIAPIEDEDSLLEDPTVDEEFVVPDWMLLAVAIDVEDMTADGEPAVMEN